MGSPYGAGVHGIDISGYTDITGAMQPGMPSPFGMLGNMLSGHGPMGQQHPLARGGIPQHVFPAGGGYGGGMHPAVAHAVAQHLAGYGPQGMQAHQGRQHDRLRRQFSPINSTLVPLTGTATGIAAPQRPIRFQRLLLASSAATPATVVTSILVGAQPQFVNSGAVPLAVYAPNAYDCEFRGDTADVGNQVQITFVNGSNANETITGGFYGEALNP